MEPRDVEVKVDYQKAFQVTLEKLLRAESNHAVCEGGITYLKERVVTLEREVQRLEDRLEALKDDEETEDDKDEGDDS